MAARARLSPPSNILPHVVQCLVTPRSYTRSVEMARLPLDIHTNMPYGRTTDRWAPVLQTLAPASHERIDPMTDETVAHIHHLAKRILRGERLESFLALPLRSQLVGLAVLAHLGGDSDVRDACLSLLDA